MAKTRLGLYGGPAQEYGAFGPKTEIIPAKTGPITRLGLYGGPRGLYGDFSPKAEIEAPIGYNRGMLSMKSIRRKRARSRR